MVRDNFNADDWLAANDPSGGKYTDADGRARSYFREPQEGAAWTSGRWRGLSRRSLSDTFENEDGQHSNRDEKIADPDTEGYFEDAPDDPRTFDDWRRLMVHYVAHHARTRLLSDFDFLYTHPTALKDGSNSEAFVVAYGCGRCDRFWTRGRVSEEIPSEMQCPHANLLPRHWGPPDLRGNCTSCGLPPRRYGDLTGRRPKYCPGGACKQAAYRRRLALRNGGVIGRRGNDPAPFPRRLLPPTEWPAVGWPDQRLNSLVGAHVWPGYRRDWRMRPRVPIRPWVDCPRCEALPPDAHRSRHEIDTHPGVEIAPTDARGRGWVYEREASVSAPPSLPWGAGPILYRGSRPWPYARLLDGHGIQERCLSPRHKRRPCAIRAPRPRTRPRPAPETPRHRAPGASVEFVQVEPRAIVMPRWHPRPPQARSRRPHRHDWSRQVACHRLLPSGLPCLLRAPGFACAYTTAGEPVTVA